MKINNITVIKSKGWFFILVLMFLTQFSSAQSEESVSLSKAIEKRWIQVEGNMNEKSVHYLFPVIVIVRNLVGFPVKIKIEAGDLMEPVDSAYQTMMFTSEGDYTIGAHKKLEIIPNAMCIEHHDMAGTKGLKYTYRKNKNQQLIEMARFISLKKYYDGSGQNAVWCIAGSEKDLLGITGYDSVAVVNLISKAATILGMKMPDQKDIRNSYAGYVKPEIKETIGGKFEFSFPKQVSIYIAMFNADGTMVRELYHNPTENPGLHKVPFEFDYTQYTDEYYTIKLIADQKVLLARKIDRDDDTWERVPER